MPIDLNGASNSFNISGYTTIDGVTMPIIERDALADTTHATPPIRDHPAHEEVKSIVMTPRMEQTLVEKMMGWFKSELKPGMHILRKDNEPMRHMFLITSNSYEDREKETITTKALEDYEASCFPGEGLFHCDNPLVYWHDDDVPMGEIIAVNVSGPFLVELVKELDTPVAKFLWDIAEETKDAGVSHRFGYLEKDRDPDGTFHRIFKQETSWLPRRDLAANELTHAGVMDMASPQSDKWLDEQMERLRGIKNASAKIHSKTGEIEKELEAGGLAHKAFPPAIAGKKPVVEADAATVVTDDAVVEADADVMDEDKEEMAPVAETASTMADLKRMAIVMDGLFNMVQTIISENAESELDRVGMLKELKELKEGRVSEKAHEKTVLDMLEDKLKALEARQQMTEKKLDMTPRSVTQVVANTDPEFAKRSVSEAIDGAVQAKKESEFVDSMFGKVLPPIKYD